MEETTIKLGSVLAGKYLIESVIGTGGMGIVLKARQTDLDRDVAIKVLQEEYRDKKDAVERFYREAKAAARVRGEHVAQIIDVGKTDEGDPYLVMEYLEGEDLGSFLRREVKLPLELSVTFMLHACSAVSDAHAARIVHRDLKPSNLFLAKMPTGTPVLKVLDFGISRIDEQASQLTHTSSSLGTAYYMSPEQIEKPRSIDSRVDVWALGCIFYEFLVGTTPFSGETMGQVVSAILRNDRRKCGAQVPGLPAEVDRVIDRCLQSEPTDRYPTVAALATALAELTQLPEHESIARKLVSQTPSQPDPIEAKPDGKTHGFTAGVLSLPIEPHTSGTAPTGLVDASVLSLSAVGGKPDDPSVLSLSAVGGRLSETQEMPRPQPAPIAAAPQQASQPAAVPKLSQTAPMQSDAARPAGAAPSAPTSEAAKAAAPLAPSASAPAIEAAKGATLLAPSAPVPAIEAAKAATLLAPSASSAPLSIESAMQPAPAPSAKPPPAPAAPPAGTSAKPPPPPAPSPIASAKPPPPPAPPAVASAKPPPPPPPVPSAKPSPPAPAAKSAAPAPLSIDSALQVAPTSKEKTPLQATELPLMAPHESMTSSDSEGAPARRVMRIIDFNDQKPEGEQKLELAARPKKKETLAPVSNRRWLRWLLIAAGGLLVTALLIVFAGPHVAVARIRAAAAKAGVTFTHDPPSFTLQGWEVGNVQASFASLPGTTLHAERVRASWGGNELTLANVDLTSASPAEDVLNALRSAEAALPETVEVLELRWHYSPRPDLTFEGAGASFAAHPIAGGRSLQLLSPRSYAKTSKFMLGPFGVNLERTPDTSRARLALDPVVPDGPSVIIVLHGGILHVAAQASRAPLARYGIQPAFLGLPEGDNPDTEISVDARANDKGIVEGNGNIAFYGLKVGASAPLDLSLAFTLDGTTSAFHLRSSDARIGPFPALVHGEWSQAAPYRANFGFQTTSVSCSELVRAKAMKQMGVAGVLVSELVKYAGTMSFQGAVSVNGSLAIDLGIPPTSTASLTSTDTCGLNVFKK